MSAWEEHQRKAVLFYLGTEMTQDEEQGQPVRLRVKIPRAAVTLRKLDHWLLFTSHKAGDYQLLFN